MSVLLRSRHLSITIMISILISAFCLLAGCSGGGQQDSPGMQNPDSTELFAQPQIPTGDADVRQGTTVDNDNVQGAGFMDSFGATIDGSAVTLEAGTTPADITAFSIYQHVARPDPAVPFMLSVIGYYQDVDPTDIDPSEGYYVLYADYNQNRWVTAGFYKTTTTRIEIPGEANVTSPSGFIYTAVVAYDGNSVRVTNVKVGYDEGPGYEQYVLPEVPGLSVGRLCDIELDEAGVPQIAYFAGSSIVESNVTTIRIARLVGDVWETQEITSVVNPEYFDFAIGSAGRRAIIIFNDDHQYLYLDTGTGEFTVEYNSEAGGDIPDDPISYIHPSITYISGTDDPLGERDTVLSLYAVTNLTDIDTMYIRADGVAPLGGGMVGGGSTPRVGDFGLATFSDNQARATIPTVGLLDSDCEFGIYSAVVDGWGPAGPSSWDDLDLGSGTREGVMIRETTGGDVVAGYRSGDEWAYVFGVWDGLTWTSLPSDTISCQVNPSERAVDFESNSLGEITFPTVYGNKSPVLYTGEIGDTNPIEPLYINSVPFSCMDFSIAIDDTDVTHMAWQRISDGHLIYSTLESGEVTLEEVVDNGADGSAMGFGPAPIVADGDSMHLFHIDLAHGQIVYSRNVGGIWETEQEPVLPVSQYPYVLVQAGLLENTGEIYVAYLDYFSLMWRVLISDPNQQSWRVEDISPFMTEYLYVADDEESIAVLYYLENLNTSELELYVDFGFGGANGITTELAVQFEDWTNPPTSLAYNHFNESWYIATNDDNSPKPYIFHRTAPGTWQGPFTIDEQISGPTAKLEVFGIACRRSDGQLSVLVSERAHGSDVRMFSILTSDPDTIVFGDKTEIISFDETLFESDWEVYTATNSQGELALKLIRQLVGDPLLDVLLFTEDAGVWDFELWDSPVHDHLAWITPGFAIMDSGDPAATMVEYDSTEPLYGRLFVYYPW